VFAEIGVAERTNHIIWCQIVVRWIEDIVLFALLAHNQNRIF